jgi:hypothetical protein
MIELFQWCGVRDTIWVFLPIAIRSDGETIVFQMTENPEYGMSVRSLKDIDDFHPKERPPEPPLRSMVQKVFESIIFR